MGTMSNVSEMLREVLSTGQPRLRLDSHWSIIVSKLKLKANHSTPNDAIGFGVDRVTNCIITTAIICANCIYTKLLLLLFVSRDPDSVWFKNTG